jgi:phosphotriesterase-related protein
MAQDGQVQTARGPVAAAGLGQVLMHEHVFVLTADVQQNYPDEWGDEDERAADAVRRLNELPEHGISTIVDVTVIGQGRNIPRIKRIADQVPGLNIVVATGVYTFDAVPMFFWQRPRETMTEFFVRDITEGIAGTGVKAGMLKCAVDEKGLTEGVERVLRSVARAHVATGGTPITIHTHAAGKHGPAIVAVLKEEGVDFGRVVLGHSGDAVRDPDYLAAMADTGLTLGMDRFGIDHFNPTADRVRTLSAMVDEGYIDQLHVSHDAGSFHDFMVGNPFFVDEHPDYLFISQTVLPLLAQAGVGEDAVQRMLVDTPRRFFGGA